MTHFLYILQCRVLLCELYMEGGDDFTFPFPINQMGPPTDIFPVQYQENILKIPHPSKYVPLSSHMQSKMAPVAVHSPVYRSKYKIDISSLRRERPRSHPESIDPLIRAVNDISISEWKIRCLAHKQQLRQQNSQQQQASVPKAMSDVELTMDIAEKMGQNAHEEREVFKSNESIESTTSTVNFTNQMSLIPFQKDFLQFEISIPPGILQVIAMLIKVLAKRFPAWRCNDHALASNNINTQNTFEGNCLTLNDNTRINNSACCNSFWSKQNFITFSQELAKHLQLQRYYCHLRNIELMAKGRHKLTQVYIEIAEAITPSIYGESLQSIPPTLGALSLVIDTLALDAHKSSYPSYDAGCYNWTYSDCHKLDVIMKRLDFLVTERSCDGNSAADAKVNLENAEVHDNVFKYLPTYPFQHKCCRYLATNTGELVNNPSYHTLQRYSVCNKCLTVCLCNCPITQEFEIECDMECNPSHFSNFSHVSRSEISDFSDFMYISRSYSHGSCLYDYNTPDEISDHSSLYSSHEVEPNHRNAINKLSRTLSVETSSAVSSNYVSFNSNTLNSSTSRWSKEIDLLKSSEGKVYYGKSSAISHSSASPQLHSTFLRAISNNGQMALIQIINSPYLRILSLICDVLKMPLPNIEIDLFWWRYIEAYFGKLLNNCPGELIKSNDTTLGKFMASIIDVDKLVSELCGSIESTVIDFKMSNPNCIDIFVPGCEHVCRRFEKDKLGPWGFYASAVEYLVILNSLTHDLVFNENTLSFALGINTPINDINDGPGTTGSVSHTHALEQKNYYIYLNGTPSCLASIFRDKNPNHSLTLANCGSDHIDMQHLDDIYESIALEAEEILMNLVDADSLETIEEVNKLQPAYRRGYFNVTVTPSKFVLCLPVHFCGICYPLRRDCIGSKRCFTCSASKEAIEEALRICGSTKHGLEVKHREIIVTFSAKLGKEECIRLINHVEEEFISECIFQACKSVSSNKVAIISPVYKKVTSFTAQSCGGMANAMAEAKKCCKMLHRIYNNVESETLENSDLEITSVTNGALCTADWKNLKQHLGAVFKRFNDRLGRRIRKSYQIKLCDEQYALMFGGELLPLVTDNITNVVALGDAIMEALKTLGKHCCSTVFVNNFDDVSPKMIT